MWFLGWTEIDWDVIHVENVCPDIEALIKIWMTAHSLTSTMWLHHMIWFFSLFNHDSFKTNPTILTTIIDEIPRIFDSLNKLNSQTLLMSWSPKHIEPIWNQLFKQARCPNCRQKSYSCTNYCSWIILESIHHI